MKLSDFGITPEFSVDNLKRAFGAFKTIVEKVRESATKKDDVEKAVRAEVGAYEKTAEKATVLADKLGEILFAEIDADPFLAVHLVERLASMADFVETEADYAIDVETRKRLEKLPKLDLAEDERAKLAEELKNMSTGMLRGVVMFNGGKLPEGIDVPFKTDKDGKVKLDSMGIPEIAFPRLTTGTRKGGGGRKSKSAYWVYSWQAGSEGDFVKLESSNMADIARNTVSTANYRVNSKQITDLLKGKVPPTSLVFPTGTLSISLPEKSEEEVSPEEVIGE